MFILIILFIAVVFGSALCSMSEAAILSLSTVRTRILLQEKRKNSIELLYVKERITETIASIVVVNNAINIVGSIFVGQQVMLRFGNQWLGVASTVLTFTIIIASEIIPKTLGQRYKVGISLMFAKPLKFLLFLFHPFLLLMMKLSAPLHEGSKPRVTEEEIKMMLKLGRAEGTVEMDEEVLCNRVFKLNDVKASQIMKPLDQVYALPADTTLMEMKEAIINCRFSRIAVYDKTPLDFIGTVQQRILLREIAKDNFQGKIRDFMKPPIFVNANTKADSLLEKFQSYHQHLFIVQDAQGKDIGLVTMEDVLEELFGEIYDERDIVRPK